MLLYALCLNPLLCTLENKLTGLRIKQRDSKTAVVAYANDVTIFVTKHNDIKVLQDALRCFEAASGAQVNIGGSKAIAVGPWDTIMDIPYHTETKILGFHITSTINVSAIKSWSTVTNRIRAQARDAYNRELSLDKRIQYVHDYLMAKVWHVAQIFPPPEDCVLKLNTSISWFLWKGDIFRVPLPTLQNRKEEGGWGLINLQAKYLALFIYRMLIQSQRDGTLTAEWMREWTLSEQSTNPPFRERIPTALGYLRRYDIESAYVAPQVQSKKSKFQSPNSKVQIRMSKFQSPKSKVQIPKSKEIGRAHV
jgi:hypothetical protein